MALSEGWCSCRALRWQAFKPIPLSVVIDKKLAETPENIQEYRFYLKSIYLYDFI
jgi:hypothetical protein